MSHHIQLPPLPTHGQKDALAAWYKKARGTWREDDLQQALSNLNGFLGPTALDRDNTARAKWIHDAFGALLPLLEALPALRAEYESIMLKDEARPKLELVA